MRYQLKNYSTDHFLSDMLTYDFLSDMLVKLRQSPLEI